jgi:hypothetical protein
VCRVPAAEALKCDDGEELVKQSRRSSGLEGCLCLAQKPKWI